MKTSWNTYKFRDFLPNYFKKIGLGVIVFFILCFIAGMVFEHKISVKKEVIATIALDGIILGLLMVSLSKSRIEDEMIFHLRLNAFVKAFVFGAAYVFAVSLTSLVMKDELAITPHSLIIVELVMFILYFELCLRKISKA